MTARRCLFLAVVSCGVLYCFGYDIPPAKLEAFYPKGLRVSIPDEQDVFLFAFHGKLNRMMDGLESGTWSGAPVMKPKGGRWVFQEENARLKIGDTVYYWIFVIQGPGRRGYTQEGKSWTVTGYTNGTLVTDEPSVDSPSVANRIPLPDSQFTFNATPISLPTSTTTLKPLFTSISTTPKLLLTSTSTTTTTPNPTVDIHLPSTSGCSPSETKISGPGDVCKGSLLFEDKFSTPLQEDRLWVPEVRFPNEPDYPFVVYLNDDKNLFVRDGKVYIKPDLLESRYEPNQVPKTLDVGSSCTGEMDTFECSVTAMESFILPPITSAKIQTKDTFSFKYGRVEVIAKLPEGDWIYPEILLEPTFNVYGTMDYASGVMRIALSKGNPSEAMDLKAGVMMGSKEPFRSYGLRTTKGKQAWNKEFVNYTLVWRPENITVYANGEEYGTVTPPTEGFAQEAWDHQPSSALWQKGTVLAPFDQMFYLSMAVNVGGINEFPDTPGKPWSNRSPKWWKLVDFWNAKDQWYATWNADTRALQVDSVRVYAL